MTLSDYFKTTRGARGDLAEKVGVTPEHLSHVAAGIRKPSPKLALAIEAATAKRVLRSDLREDIWPNS